ALPICVYAEGTFDLAGTIVGVVEESRAIHGDKVQPGDVLLAWQSSGLHTNGYTLARRVLLDGMKLSLDADLPGTSASVAESLLAVHRSYHAAISPVLDRVHALAHITGGGIAGNLVRVLPSGIEAVISTASWQWPAIFSVIADGGRVSREEMREVFNLGVGMLAAVPPDQVDAVQTQAERAGVPAWVIGECRAGDRSVRFAD